MPTPNNAKRVYRMGDAPDKNIVDVPNGDERAGRVREACLRGQDAFRGIY